MAERLVQQYNHPRTALDEASQRMLDEKPGSCFSSVYLSPKAEKRMAILRRGGDGIMVPVSVAIDKALSTNLSEDEWQSLIEQAEKVRAYINSTNSDLDLIGVTALVLQEQLFKLSRLASEHGIPSSGLLSAMAEKGLETLAVVQ